MNLNLWQTLRQNYCSLYPLFPEKGTKLFRWEIKLFFSNGNPKMPAIEEVKEAFRECELPLFSTTAFFTTSFIEFIWNVQKADVLSLFWTEKKVSPDKFRYAGVVIRERRPFFRFRYNSSELKDYLVESAINENLADDLFLYYPLKNSFMREPVFGGEIDFCEFDGSFYVVWRKRTLSLIFPPLYGEERLIHLLSSGILPYRGIAYYMPDWNRVIKKEYNCPLELSLIDREASDKRFYKTFKPFIERVKFFKERISRQSL